MFDCLKDKSKLSTFKAFIHETLRLYPPALGTNPRKATKAFSVKTRDGETYNIEKYTPYAVNICLCNRSPTMWSDHGNPNDFNISNFLDENGNFVTSKLRNVMTFGVGPRMCPGRYLGIKLLQITAAFFIAHYEMSLECKNGEDINDVKIEFEWKDGFNVPDCNLPVVFQPRLYGGEI